jgi:uncharacterized membrane protein (UPF0127 family)
MSKSLNLGKNLILYSLFFLLTFKSAIAFDDRDYNTNLQIINGKDDKIITSFKVKIAQNTQSQEKGLMFLESMPGGNGLLIDFGSDRIARMWMKNTYFSLDMLFIDKHNKIIKIVSSTDPLSEKIVSSKALVRKVLEINAGLSRRMDIKAGDRIKLK